jgi:hypothetical protein
MGGRARGLWMIGPEVGTFSGGLANRADKICVEQVDSVWKFADGTSWVKDPLLKVQCEKDFTGRRFSFSHSFIHSRKWFRITGFENMICVGVLSSIIPYKRSIIII